MLPQFLFGQNLSLDLLVCEIFVYRYGQPYDDFHHMRDGIPHIPAVHSSPKRMLIVLNDAFYQ